CATRATRGSSWRWRMVDSPMPAQRRAVDGAGNRVGSEYVQARRGLASCLGGIGVDRAISRPLAERRQLFGHRPRQGVGGGDFITQQGSVQGLSRRKGGKEPGDYHLFDLGTAEAVGPGGDLIEVHAGGIDTAFAQMDFEDAPPGIATGEVDEEDL